jgi:hypothetical protein
MSSKRTQPQLMCCVLVTPKGPNFGRTKKVRNQEEILEERSWE